MAIIEQDVVIDQLNRIVEIFVTSDGEIRPHFILTGPSGSGKSHIVGQLAEDSGINMLEINAAQLTKEGTSGNSLSKALAPLCNRAAALTICFVDEFDKLFVSGNSNSDLAHETTNGVQNEFLRVLESKTTSVFGDYGKYVDVAVDKVLFVFAGAFNGETDITLDRLRGFGIKTEFLGRVGLHYGLQRLSIKSMHQVLLKSTLFDTYLTLFPEVNSEEAVHAIMAEVEKQHDNNTLGIRLLSTLMHQYFINDGKLVPEEVAKSAFQKTLNFRSGQKLSTQQRLNDLTRSKL